jgi:hypothetical protein
MMTMRVVPQIRIAITKYIAQNPDPAEAIDALFKKNVGIQEPGNNMMSMS